MIPDIYITDPPCYYRLHWMTNNPLFSDYSRDELTVSNLLILQRHTLIICFDIIRSYHCDDYSGKFVHISNFKI